jgi:hypothetical protein
VALFMTDEEKLKCDWPAATPAMRLGGEHWRASMLPLRPLAAAPVVCSGGAAVERARWQRWQRKAKCSVGEEGKKWSEA